MSRYWNLKDAFYQIFHSWPKLVLFFLAGCLAGWSIGMLWPVPFRAVAQIHVGINPYRGLDDSRFLAQARPRYSNVDDYKNWQMAQLDEFIRSDLVMEDTLNRLRAVDDRWEQIDLEQLRETVQAEWRTAGEWSLIAEMRDRPLAAQAAETWRTVVVEAVTAAVTASQDAIFIDEKTQALAAEQAQAQARAAQLAQVERFLQEQSALIQAQPVDQPLSQPDQWRLFAALTPVVEFNPVWHTVLQSRPVSTALPAAYSDWIQQLLVVIESEQALTEATLGQLAASYTDLQAAYAAQSQASQGLAPTLEVSSTDIFKPQPVRQTGAFALMGGIVGVLAWIYYQLAFLSQRKTEAERV